MSCENYALSLRELAFVCSLMVTVFTVACSSDGPQPDTDRPRDVAQGPQPRLAVFAVTPGYDIATVDASGRRMRILTGESKPESIIPQLFTRLTWSPNGRRVAFAGVRRRTDRSGNRADIYTISHEGGESHRVTRLGDAVDPAWSPDGRSIVFTRLQARPEGDLLEVAGSLWAISPRGGDLRRITPTVRGSTDTAGSFTPDGTRLLFARATCEPVDGDSCGRRSSVVMISRADGSDERKLVERAADPVVSPNGTRLAFVSDRDGNGALTYADRVVPANELYVADLDGTDPRRLTRTDGKNEAAPSWLPGGARIAFQRGVAFDNAQATGVYQVNADGTCELEILSGLRRQRWYASPAWRPGVSRRGEGRLRC